MEDAEERQHPEDAEGADAEADDDHRADRIAGAAQHGGEDLDERPGEIEGHKVPEHLPGGGDDGRVFGQDVQEGPRREHDEGAEHDGDPEAEEEPLLHAEPDAVFLSRAEVLPDKAGDCSAERVAHGPENAVDLRRHRPGGDHDRAEGIHADLDDQVGDAVHGVLQAGGNPEAEHAGEVRAPETELPEAQPVGFFGAHELPGQQKHVQKLRGDRCRGDARDAPAEEDDKRHIKHDVGDAARHHVDEGAVGIAHRAQHVRLDVQHQDKGHAEEVDPEVEHRRGERVLRRPQKAEHGRRGGEARRHQQHAHQGEDRDGVADRKPHRVVALGAVKLRDDHRGPGRHGNEEADEHGDDLRGAAAHGREGDRADKAADNQPVDRVVELLDAGPRRDGEEEHDQALPNGAGNQVAVPVPHGCDVFHADAQNTAPLQKTALFRAVERYHRRRGKSIPAD